MNSDIVTKLRARAQALRDKAAQILEEAEQVDRTATILDDHGELAQTPPGKRRATAPEKAKKGKAGRKPGPRPTTAAPGGQPELGKRAQKRATALEGMRRLLAQDPEMSVTALQQELGIGWNLAKELHAELQ